MVLKNCGLPIADCGLVLSHFQTSPLLKAREQGLESVSASIDLGITTIPFLIQSDGIAMPDSTILKWDVIQEIDANKKVCYSIQNGTGLPIRRFSETLGRACSLMPTDSAPVMVIAGFPMHRFKNITPVKAALAMVEPLAPLTGSVLDTATGLGYTAIEAAKKASHVTTIELCPETQEMARMNPWSQGLFDNPRISQIIGDSAEEIRKFADEDFSAIIHDPPTLSLAGELYSGAFYREAFRVLRRRGKLFHYIGDPESDSGSRVTKGVVKRLYDAGFKKVVPVQKAFGVVAYK